MYLNSTVIQIGLQGGGVQPEEAGGGDSQASGGNCQGVDERRHVLVRRGHGLSAQRGTGKHVVFALLPDKVRLQLRTVVVVVKNNVCHT